MSELKIAKAPNYDDIASIPEIWSQDIPNRRKDYIKAKGVDTTLTDADIVNMIAYAEDDYNPQGWVNAMVQIENGELPTFEDDEG